MPMNTEERFERIDRQMQLVGEHLLLAASHLDRLTSEQHETDGRLSQLARATDARLRQLAEAQFATDARLTQLAEAQHATVGWIRQLAEALTQLTEKQQSTDARLNILINVIERYFSNGGRN